VFVKQEVMILHVYSELISTANIEELNVVVYSKVTHVQINILPNLTTTSPPNLTPHLTQTVMQMSGS
jgi:hypothetical protein